MKKIFWIAAPVALVALLLSAHSVLSYGGMRHGHGGGMFSEMMVMHLEHMAKDLNLTSDQQAKLDAIEKGMQQSMDQGMSKREEFHNTIQKQLSSGYFDFSQLRPMLDAQIDERAATSHATVASLQQFYDGLTADQKTKIANEMKKDMDEMQERRDRWQQHKSDDSKSQQQN